MKCKCRIITGIIILIVGLAAIIYAVQCMNRIKSAKGTVNKMEGYMSKNPAGKMAGHMAEGQTSKYDSEVMWLLIGGIVLAVIGGGTLICCKRKK